MQATYDDDVLVDLTIGHGAVFSWLRVKGASDVRVQAHRKFVKDAWGLDWSDQNSLKAEFRWRRNAYKDAAMKCTGGGKDFRVYEIG
jgi:hypothetical protein